MKHLNHANVNQLLGIAFRDNQVLCVWPFGRGSIRSLLDDNKIALDQNVRMSLIQEIIAVSKVRNFFLMHFPLSRGNIHHRHKISPAFGISLLFQRILSFSTPNYI